MPLPPELRKAVEDLADGVPGAALARAARELTEAYKSAEGRTQQTVGFHTDAHRAAYAVVRLPATFAACEHALTELSRRLPGFAPRTVLDLGSGPGTASWAAAVVFPTIERITLLERDAGLIELGKKLATHSANTGTDVGAPPLSPSVGDRVATSAAEWLRRDLTQPLPEGNWDLVIASYSIGELRPDARAALIARAWKQAGALLLIEPGTHAGFAVIESARRQLIAAGAELAAPCPHMGTCPMLVTEDWCHFAARLERSSAHRRAKGGELAYEDEKFSYVAAAHGEVQRAESRIVRHPLRNPGHVQLTICTAEGLRQQTIGKSAKDLYRAAKKSEWGDGWESADSRERS